MTITNHRIQKETASNTRNGKESFMKISNCISQTCVTLRYHDVNLKVAMIAMFTEEMPAL